MSVVDLSGITNRLGIRQGKATLDRYVKGNIERTSKKCMQNMRCI